jgi:hypothetical protein
VNHAYGSLTLSLDEVPAETAVTVTIDVAAEPVLLGCPRATCDVPRATCPRPTCVPLRLERLP